MQIYEPIIVDRIYLGFITFLYLLSQETNHIYHKADVISFITECIIFGFLNLG